MANIRLLGVLAGIALIACSIGVTFTMGRTLSEQEMYAVRGAANDKCVDSADDDCVEESGQTCAAESDPVSCGYLGRDKTESGSPGEWFQCTENQTGYDCTYLAGPFVCRTVYSCMWDYDEFGNGYCATRPSPNNVFHEYLASDTYSIYGDPCP